MTPIYFSSAGLENWQCRLAQPGLHWKHSSSAMSLADAWEAANPSPGSQTIKETVNRALRQAGGDHRQAVKRRLDLLARADLAAREQAWR